MNVLFKRTQSQGNQLLADIKAIPVISNFTPRPWFRLWAKIELDSEEQAVSNHYHFDKYILLDAFEPDLLRRTAYVFGGVFAAALLVFSAMTSFSTGLWLGFIAAAVAAYLYYEKHRERMQVSDLLAGHYYKCKSIVDLARKEAMIETASQFLRQVMESAKHWDGTETVKVEALSKEEAKRIIIKGL